MYFQVSLHNSYARSGVPSCLVRKDLVSKRRKSKMPGVTLHIVGILSLIHLTESRLLPSFSVLKANYPGHEKHGGIYPDEMFLKATGLSGRVTVNDTCPLRVSTMLNLISGQAILRRPAGNDFVNGTGGLYYFSTARGLSRHLHRMYGEPVAGTLDTFKGVSGIMLPVNMSDPRACHALLWDGFGFHQVRGFIKRTNISWILFWQAPSEACTMNVNIKKDSACFTSESSVQLSSGDTIAMKDLTVGDEILTYTHQGAKVPTQVLTFIHQDPDHVGRYHTVTTEDGVNIVMSETHLIFKMNTETSSVESIHVSRLKVGDLIFVQASDRHNRRAVKVVGVSFVLFKGAFAPITNEGTMIVDEVWVSCYADISDHGLAHSLMAPLRFLYSVAPKWLGSRGVYIHEHLKSVFRPLGVRVLGKEKFYGRDE